MELVGDISRSGKVYHLVHHIARTCHHETHVSGLLQNSVSGLDEILRSFLHGYSAKESHDLVLSRSLLEAVSVGQRLDGVVHCGNLRRILSVFLYDGLACEVGNADYVVSLIHASSLYVIDLRVDIASRPVEVSGVNMDNQRLAGNVLGEYAGRVSQPVVRVDNIESALMSHDRSHSLIVGDFLHQILGIHSRKVDTAKLVCSYAAEIITYIVTQLEILIWVHGLADSRIDMVP